MPDTQRQDDSRDEQIAVTLKLDPKVYEFFMQKAQAAGVGIESYLCSTLSIVLGCRAFSKMSVCSPQFPGEGCATDDAK
jgi:hypothetical protein